MHLKKGGSCGAALLHTYDETMITFRVRLLLITKNNNPPKKVHTIETSGIATLILKPPPLPHLLHASWYLFNLRRMYSAVQ